MTVFKIKKQKTQKRYIIERKPKFENYKNCFNTIQFHNKIENVEKMKLAWIVLKKTIKNS